MGYLLAVRGVGAKREIKVGVLLEFPGHDYYSMRDVEWNRLLIKVQAYFIK
jgi:hypothetical protein